MRRQNEPAGREPEGLYRPERPGGDYGFSSWLFVRLLAGIYLIAFLSLWVQVTGLFGERGILSIAKLLEVVSAQQGVERYLRLPTLLWLGSGDGALHLLCALGTVAALLAAIGRFQRLALLVAWAAYLSLVAAGQEFMGFQWDALLLESGLLAIFLAPAWRPRLAAAPPPPSRVTLWLFWWLLFRLCFSSGIVKLTSGDASWRELSALTYHYQTQPLPNPVAWLAHQLPGAFHAGAAALALVVEIAVPFALFVSPRLRRWAFWPLAGLQVAIAATGNFAFFNLLTLALCVLLLNDAWWHRRFGLPLGPPAPRWSPWDRWVAPWAAVVLLVSFLQLVAAVRPGISPPAPLSALARGIAPLRAVNSYGLFRVMTTRRLEIVVEGTLDGTEWREYSFRYKPGPLDRRPPFVAPHQPRLDWQMWFAALGEARSHPFFFLFLSRLAQGSPEVLALLAEDPFEGELPGMLRARLYEYRFTTLEERRAGGGWWVREFRGLYLPRTPASSLARLFPVATR